jgi:hypothetical protein
LKGAHFKQGVVQGRAMKILFVMDRRVDAGSIQAVANYVHAGDEMGHTIALYGRPDPKFPRVRFSTNAEAFDAVLFIVESGLNWITGLRMARFVSGTPRAQRAVLDADGMCNPLIAIDGYDRNHASERERSRWIAHIRTLADRVMQPTLNPLDPETIAVPFYGYDINAEMGINEQPNKSFDVMHVAHNWWRWREVSTVLLPALGEIRARLNKICFVGSWWDGAPFGLDDPSLAQAFCVDKEKLREFRIQVSPSVPYTEVIHTMSQGRVNIMTQRPLLHYLKIFTSKYFEIFCADTIPLVMIDPNRAQSVYGPSGRELALHDDISGKVLDALERPQKYWDIVEDVRRHLATHHCYRQRVQDLVAALNPSHPN